MGRPGSRPHWSKIGAGIHTACSSHETHKIHLNDLQTLAFYKLVSLHLNLAIITSSSDRTTGQQNVHILLCIISFKSLSFGPPFLQKCTKRFQLQGQASWPPAEVLPLDPPHIGLPQSANLLNPGSVPVWVGDWTPHLNFAENKSEWNKKIG